MGNKKIKEMQNREELRQKGYYKSIKKPVCQERRKNIIFVKVGGTNIVFGPKYRLLEKSLFNTAAIFSLQY
jgi:hypothetical protein